MTAWQIVLAAVAGIVVYTVAVAFPLGVAVGRAIHAADVREHTDAPLAEVVPIKRGVA